MDLIHKEDVVLAEVGQQRGQIPGFSMAGPGGDADIDPHLLRDDPASVVLPRPGGRGTAHDQRFLPLPGRLNKMLRFSLPFPDRCTPPESWAAERFLSVLRQEGLGHNGLLVNIVSKINAHSVTSYAVKFIFWMHAAGSASAGHYFTIFFRLWRIISSSGRVSTSTPLRAICTSCVE